MKTLLKIFKTLNIILTHIFMWAYFFLGLTCTFILGYSWCELDYSLYYKGDDFIILLLCIGAASFMIALNDMVNICKQ